MHMTMYRNRKLHVLWEYCLFKCLYNQKKPTYQNTSCFPYEWEYIYNVLIFLSMLYHSSITFVEKWICMSNFNKWWLLCGVVFGQIIKHEEKNGRKKVDTDIRQVRVYIYLMFYWYDYNYKNKECLVRFYLLDSELHVGAPFISLTAV